MHGLKSTDTPGLYKLGNVYWCKITVAGQRRERSLRTESKTAALAQLGTWRKELEVQSIRTNHASGADKHDTVGWWLVRLRHKYRRDPMSSAKHKIYVAERVRGIQLTWPGVLKRRPVSITPNEIEVYRDTLLRAGKAAATVRGNMLVLSMALDLAIVGGTLPVNPLAGLKRPQSPKMSANKQQLSPDQFESLLNEQRKKPGLTQRACDLAEFLACTGLRIGEANKLTWGDVNWEKREITAWASKGRKANGTDHETKTLPFHRRLETLLKRLWGTGQPVLDSICRVKECSGTLDTICEEAGIQHITQHGLRHYFTTWAIEAGVDIPTVSRWLGHRDGGALAMKVYGHLRNEHSHKMADLLK